MQLGDSWALPGVRLGSRLGAPVGQLGAAWAGPGAQLGRALGLPWSGYLFCISALISCDW